MYPLVRDLAINGIPVVVTCRVLNLGRAPYYRWLKNPVTQRERKQAVLANAVFDAHRADPEFGYRLLADQVRELGFKVCDRTVWRICSHNRWWCRFGKPKKHRKSSRPGRPVHDDLVKRDFSAETPNELWLSDITEHPTREGKIYMCAVKDVFSNRIVGYSIKSHMQASLVTTAIDSAVARRTNVAGCVYHSDRGGQFRSTAVQKQLKQHKLKGSMGQVASAADNASMESFFSLLQKNVLDRQTWTTRTELRTAIIHWIEATYHRRRKQKTLGQLTPIQYETKINQTAKAA